MAVKLYVHSHQSTEFLKNISEEKKYVSEIRKYWVVSSSTFKARTSGDLWTREAVCTGTSYQVTFREVAAAVKATS